MVAGSHSETTLNDKLDKNYSSFSQLSKFLKSDRLFVKISRKSRVGRFRDVDKINR